MQRIAHICALTLLLAGCGGGSADEKTPSQGAQAPQFYKSCGYEYHEGGIVPSGYRYSCSIVGKCEPDRTCTACTPGGSC